MSTHRLATLPCDEAVEIARKKRKHLARTPFRLQICVDKFLDGIFLSRMPSEAAFVRATVILHELMGYEKRDKGLVDAKGRQVILYVLPQEYGLDSREYLDLTHMLPKFFVEELRAWYPQAAPLVLSRVRIRGPFLKDLKLQNAINSMTLTLVDYFENKSARTVTLFAPSGLRAVVIEHLHNRMGALAGDISLFDKHPLETYMNELYKRAFTS